MLGYLQRGHRRQINRLQAPLDPTLGELLSAPGTHAGCMIDPVIGTLQFEASATVLWLSFGANFLLPLGGRRLDLRSGTRQRSKGNAA